MNILDVIIAPVITEKSMKNAQNGKYTFKVATKANKNLISQAIENKFKVNVVGITTVLVKNKTEKRGARRQEFVKSTWKKAIARLAKDQKIGLFDVGGEKK